MFCIKCNKEIDRDSMFCKYCGNEVINENTESTGIIDSITDCEYLIPFRKNGLWGFSDKNKNIVIDCIYDEVMPFISEYTGVKKNDNWGFVDVKGAEILPCVYKSVRYFSEGLSAVQIEDIIDNDDFDHFGYIDITGKKAFPFVYERGTNFINGLAIVYNTCEKREIIDKNGKSILPNLFDDITVTDDGLFRVMLGDREIEMCKYNLHEGLRSTFRSTLRYGCYDEKGTQILPCQFEYVSRNGFKEGLIVTKYETKYGCVDYHSKEVIPFIYDNIESFSEGLAAVRKNSYWGFIDKKGEQLIPIIYQEARSFSEGLAALKRLKKWGYVNLLGEVVIPFIYDEAYNFKNGIALVSINGNPQKIDKNGNEIRKIKIGKNLNKIYHGNLYGLCDNNNKEITACIYEEINDFFDGFAAVKLNENWGFIDEAGNLRIKNIYDKLNKESKVLKPHQTGSIYCEFDIIERNIGDDLHSIYSMKFSNGIALVEKNGIEFFIDKNGNEYYEPSMSEIARALLS